MNWGSITWQISARGEISARLTGLKFHLGFLNKFCQRDACNYMKKVSVWLKFPAWFHKTGCEFQPGKKFRKTSCNGLKSQFVSLRMPSDSL